MQKQSRYQHPRNLHERGDKLLFTFRQAFQQCWQSGSLVGDGGVLGLAVELALFPVNSCSCGKLFAEKEGAGLAALARDTSAKVGQRPQVDLRPGLQVAGHNGHGDGTIEGRWTAGEQLFRFSREVLASTS
jgi:hypothetical protein